MTFALALGLGACGDSSSGGPEFDDEATTAQTMNAASDASGGMTSMITAMNFGTPQIILATSAAAARFRAKLPVGRPHAGPRAGAVLGSDPVAAVRAAVAAGCEVTAHGIEEGDLFDWIDENNNGIPDDWGMKVVCVEVDGSDSLNIATYRSTEEFSVKENTTALHGYEAHVRFSWGVKDQQGYEGGESFSGAEVLDLRSGAIALNRDFRGRSFETDGEELWESSGGEEFEASFDPSLAIDPDLHIPDGDLSFTGRIWFAETGALSLSFSLQTTTPLVYSAACATADANPPFTAGVVRGRLNGRSGSAQFELTMNACADYSVTTSGTTTPTPIIGRR